jgi:hypothetical protein
MRNEIALDGLVHAERQYHKQIIKAATAASLQYTGVVPSAFDPLRSLAS